MAIWRENDRNNSVGVPHKWICYLCTHLRIPGYNLPLEGAWGYFLLSGMNETHGILYLCSSTRGTRVPVPSQMRTVSSQELERIRLLSAEKATECIPWVWPRNTKSGVRAIAQVDPVGSPEADVTAIPVDWYDRGCKPNETETDGTEIGGAGHRYVASLTTFAHPVQPETAIASSPHSPRFPDESPARIEMNHQSYALYNSETRHRTWCNAVFKIWTATFVNLAAVNVREAD